MEEHWGSYLLGIYTERRNHCFTRPEFLVRIRKGDRLALKCPASRSALQPLPGLPLYLYSQLRRSVCNYLLQGAAIALVVGRTGPVFLDSTLFSRYLSP